MGKQTIYEFAVSAFRNGFSWRRLVAVGAGLVVWFTIMMAFMYIAFGLVFVDNNGNVAWDGAKPLYKIIYVIVGLVVLRLAIYLGTRMAAKIWK